jgi:hypothetical protein
MPSQPPRLPHIQFSALPLRLDVPNILEGDGPGTIVVLPPKAIIALRLTSRDNIHDYILMFFLYRQKPSDDDFALR